MSVHEGLTSVAREITREYQCFVSVHERLTSVVREITRDYQCFASVHEGLTSVAREITRDYQCFASVHERLTSVLGAFTRDCERFASVYERLTSVSGAFTREYERSRVNVIGHLSMRDGLPATSACVCQSRWADGYIFLRRFEKCPQCPLESIAKVRLLDVPGNSYIFSNGFSRAIRPVGDRCAVHEEHEVSRRRSCSQARARRLTLDGSTAPA